MRMGQANSVVFNKIEIMQNKVVRIMAGAEHDAHCDPLYKEHKFLKVKDQLSVKKTHL